MLPIIKNIYKNYLQSIVIFALFIIASLTIMIGFLSGPLKLKPEINQINREVNKWDYSQTLDFDTITDSSLYNYLFAIDNKSIINSFNEPILNLDQTVNNDDGSNQRLVDFLESGYKNNGNQRITYTRWLINYLERTLFNPSQIDWETNRLWFDNNHYGNLNEIINKQWLENLISNHFLPFNLLSQDLLKTYNSNHNGALINQNSLQIRSNISLTPNAAPTQVFFETANFNQLNNLVISETYNNQPITKISDNQVVINSAYGQKNGLFPGNVLSLPSFLNANHEATNLGGDYQIQGYGIKIYDVLRHQKTKPTLLMYVSDDVLDRLSTYLVKNSNTLITEAGSYKDFAQTYTTDLLTLKSGQNINPYQTFLKDNGIKSKALSKNNDSNLTTLFDVMQLQISLIVIVNIFNFIILLAFLVMYLGNMINKNLGQWGILIANGFNPFILSFNFAWITTTLTIFLSCLSYALSIPLQGKINDYFTDSLNIALPSINANAFFLCLFFIVMPIVIGIISGFIAWIRLQKSPLLLIYPRTNNYRRHIPKLVNRSKSFSLRLTTSFYFSQWNSHIYLFVLFLLVNVLVLTQLSIPPIIKATKEARLFYTNPNISYRDGNNFDVSWSVSDGRFERFDEKNLPTFNPYNDHQNVQPTITLQNLMNSYINADRDDEDIKNKLWDILMKLGVINLNQAIINLELMSRLINSIVNDKETVWKDDAIATGIINQLEKQLKPMINQLTSNIANHGQSTLFTLNNIYLNNKQKLVTSIPLNVASGNFYEDNFDLVLLNQSNASIFKGGEKLLKTSDQFESAPALLPIIINQRLATQDHVKIGQKITLKASDSFGDEMGEKITAQVIGINTKDDDSENMYISEDIFKENYLITNEGQKPYYNQIFSTEKWDIKTDGQALDLPIDFLNFWFPQPLDSNDPITFLDIAQHFDELSSFNSLPFVNSNFESFDLTRQKVAEMTGTLNTIITIMAIAEIVIVVLLLITILQYLLLLKSQTILMLKLLGYYNREIIGYLFGPYIIDYLLALIVSYILLTVVFAVIKKAVLLIAHVYIKVPFGAYLVWWPILLTIFVMIIGWIISHWFLAKINLRD